MTKEAYIAHAHSHFHGEALELVLKQIERFYSCDVTVSHSYEVGDTVMLKKGTFLHGIPSRNGNMTSFDWVTERGFIAVDMTKETTTHKIKNSIGMWKIDEDVPLRSYIEAYSGCTLTYSVGRGPLGVEHTILVPYHKFDEVTESLLNNDSIWTYRCECTKEVRFMPNLVADNVQIGFILDMSSPKAREMAKADVWDTDLSPEVLKYFTDARYYDKFVKERFSRTPATTDREVSIIFGLPSCLIEGVIVGRIAEKDNDIIRHIKEKLPQCYICSLDGVVTVK